jgi:hypothetical protein
MQVLRSSGPRAAIGLRRWVPRVAVLLVLTWIVASVAIRALAATGTDRVVIIPSRAGRTISLRDRLVVGLQARLKPEVAFVELVAAKVRDGDLPQRLVDETFFWARQRATDPRSGRKRRPIIFFQPAMRARAQRIRVAL